MTILRACLLISAILMCAGCQVAGTGTFMAKDVRAFGAVGDGHTLNTAAIQRAVDAVAAEGGGTVFFPAGDYLTGTVRLRDDVTLHLGEGSTIWGSTRIEDYDAKEQHLLFAEDAENIAIVGRGAIDGQGPRFWDGGRLERWLKGEGDLVRTSDMIRFDRCKNVTLEDVEVRYGAFWNIGFGDCERITIRALTMINGIYENDGPNTDGINLWNCKKIRISDCDIQTGDDCIVVLGESRDVTITNCKFTTSETALMISGVRNLTFSNSTIHDAGCGVGFRVWNGIVVDGVRVDNIVMDVSDRFDTGGQVVYLWSFPLYVEEAPPPGTVLPAAGVVDNVTLSNITAKANGGIFVTGFREAEGYVRSLTLENIDILMNGGMDKSTLNDNPPDPYPIYGFHGAPYAIFVRFVKHLELRNVTFRWNTPERAAWGSAVRCWSVDHVEIDGFEGRQSAGSSLPAIWLRDVERAFVHGCLAPEGTGTFLHLGAGTEDVTLLGNDLSQARVALTAGPGANPKVFESGNRQPKK
ncbi:MAG: right-handed parallel beta-helix repeat-containing protein [Planctomycetes bacterium]|nr:right-handed parallel beta-helix repeat-containing protein [Planctomycetota bacterium]